MQDDFEYDALTIRPPQRTRTRWYTRLWPACLGRGCLGRRRQRFPLYLIGYDPVGRFQRAASVGDVASVEWFINASEHHVDECDRRGRSALHYASAHNHPNVVTLLSSNDCTNINLKDDEGCTPLIKATQRDNIECVSILLRHGADPHIVDANGDAALHHAICRGNINIVSKLLEYNVDIKAKTAYGLTPYQLALFENQHAMVEFLIKKGVNPDSELTPNSGGAAAVESEQSKRKCVTFNKEENFSTDIMPSCSAVRPPRQLKSVLKKSFQINRASRRLKDQISISEGTMTREPEQRKKKCVTFNNEVHYSTDQKPFCSRVRPPGELKSILKKSIQISGDNGRNKDQLSLRLSENPHVPGSTTEDKAGTSVVKIIQKKILYSKKIAAMKQRDQAELCQSVKDIRFLRHFLRTEALPEYPRKKTCLLVENKKGEDSLPPHYMHDIMHQPPAHADATSTCHVSNRGDNLHASEETTVNTTTADPTPSLGDVLNPTQNCNMRVLASSPPEHTRYAVNTPSTIFLIWAIFTSLLLLTTLIWVVKFVTLEMPWVMDLI